MTGIPSFAGVDHPLFAHDWLLTGADRLFAAKPESLERLEWNFWGTYDYSDQEYLEGHSDINFRWREKQEPTQEELDEIPAVRMMERKANLVVDLMPITIDSDGDGGASTNGEAKLTMSPGLIEFRLMPPDHQDDAEWLVVVKATWREGAWVNETFVAVPPQGCLTDRAAHDYQAVLEASLDLSILGLAEMPTVIDARMATDEDVDDDVGEGLQEGWMIFRLRDDAFDSFYGREDGDDVDG